MIKINLLPQQKRAKVTNVEKDFVLFVLGIVFVAVSVYVVDYYYSGLLAGLNNSYSQKMQTKQMLEVQVARVNTVLNELSDIENRIQIIKDVRKKQGLPVKYIDEIVINIPQNKMWLETFTVSSSGAIVLTGVALDNQAFAAYVESLRASNYIANVNTQRTSRRSVDGLGLISFQCSVIAQEYFENLNSNGTSNG